MAKGRNSPEVVREGENLDRKTNFCRRHKIVSKPNVLATRESLSDLHEKHLAVHELFVLRKTSSMILYSVNIDIYANFPPFSGGVQLDPEAI